MALSPPLSFNPFPSHFHYPPLSPSSSPSPTTLPILQIRKPFLTHFNPHKITFSSTALATQIQNEEHPETEITSDTKKKKKKKKKLRPGFYDQTQERWSVKIASNRTQFPWQEKPKSLESSPGFLLSSVPTDLSEVKADNPSLGIESSSFPPRNRVILAPWAHGAKQGKPHLNSEVRKRALVDETVEGHVDVEEAKSLNIHGEAEKALFGGKQIETHLESETEIQVATERIGDGAMEGEEAKSVQVCRDVEKSTVGIIVEKLKNLGTERNSDSDGKDRELPSCVEDPNNFGSDTNHNVCHYPGPFQDSEEEQRLYSYRNSATLTHLIDNSGSIRLPWERERGPDGERWRKSNTELAEKTIPEPELHRLRNVALRMKERMKVGAAGITQAVVDEIHDKWKEEEVVKIKFEGPPALNMKRTHEVLERKTGGLVIWRSGSSLVLYRGMTYKLPCVQSYVKHTQTSQNIIPHSEQLTIDVRATEPSSSGSMTAFEGEAGDLTDISYVNSLLDELGPRFQDWSGCDPMPVDADLLPGLVPEYKPPYRLLPYGMRHCLHNRQMTSLRRLARRVPPHFALGRNRKHQGLAKAMVKLWEKSSIAKIAIKRGVPNTSNERIAEELKISRLSLMGPALFGVNCSTHLENSYSAHSWKELHSNAEVEHTLLSSPTHPSDASPQVNPKILTGGTLVSRNKDYIVFYRGNDFLPPAMKGALVERQKLAKIRQDEEEQARLRASTLIASNAKTASGPFVAGTLAETLAANSRWGNQLSSDDRAKMMRNVALAKHAALVRYSERKLAHAQEKVKKAEKALRKVQEYLEPADLPTDLETITDEERFLFRKIGLSMKPFLLLGRRGVFDGTVENMHLHWKYRELVKIIVKGKSFQQVKHIAISLEAESGGVLISLDKTSKGYAIVVYRGKNYQRPQTLRPKNLLTRRQALARSIELQRREALNHHILDLRKRIEIMKSELEQMETIKDVGDEGLYSQLDDAYSSEDDVEDEGEEAYLETYDSGDEAGDGDAEIGELANKREPI
ncbi:CRM-domain containing factor CFM3A, chloroplastic/mitochondrial-like isoform X2 [Magnolia sinica]|uniref:CRM-domain containing factor CFM3A, chloroplastic/mitochondrial-like isoform X2 n=1 Tax=Magnolia sinica TaxID=86752 RepID=UPI00265B5920|nr:CRM-domain containing factor CFM3A, chloroplastic/mitochondrial-like isoform X2 [Magnolia sinica]